MCNCPACDRGEYTPLERDKWKVGQRVKWWYHAPHGEPIENHGVIVPRPPTLLAINGKDGILIKPDSPEVRTFWSWDFMIQRGIGYTSAILEE